MTRRIAACVRGKKGRDRFSVFNIFPVRLTRGRESVGHSEAALVEIHDSGFDRHRGQLSGP